MENQNPYQTLNAPIISQKAIYFNISMLGWFMYITCGWISFKNLILDDNSVSKILTVYRFLTDTVGENVYGLIYPLQLEKTILYIVIGITLIFASLTFFICIANEEAIFGGIINCWSEFHFITFFITSSLFLIGMFCKDKDIKELKGANIAGFILDILGLASLIYIYIKTDLPGDWYQALIKKGTYSSLIALEWYYFCYLICNLACNDPYDYQIIRGLGIPMSIIEGIVALAFAFYYKDVIIALMNVLIFIGAAVYYLSISPQCRVGGNGNAEGIIDIILSELSLVVTVLLIYMRKKECLK